MAMANDEWRMMAPHLDRKIYGYCDKLNCRKLVLRLSTACVVGSLQQEEANALFQAGLLMDRNVKFIVSKRTRIHSSFDLRWRQSHYQQLNVDVRDYDHDTVATTAKSSSLPLLEERHHMNDANSSSWNVTSSLLSLNKNVQVLSHDPFICLVSNFLSLQECEDYQNYVVQLPKSEERQMTRSNPPEVFLNFGRLWPLPILSLGAGIPPLIRLWQQQDSSGVISTTTTNTEPIYIQLNTVLSVVLPNILLAFGLSLLVAYGIVLPLIRAVSQSSSRTSVAIALNTEQDIDFIRSFVNRVCNMTNHSWDKWEAPVVTRYDPGAIFARHGDASPTLQGKEWDTLGGQRVITCICYLNTVQQGGQTYFDQVNISVSPKAGQALIFSPACWDTLEADPRTTHESLPTVHPEEKWIVQLFGRIRRVPSPLGLPDKFNSF